MTPTTAFSCYLIGAESLLIPCAEELISRGHVILGVITDDPAITTWCGERTIRVIPSRPNYAPVLADTPFDYLLSITNLAIIPPEVLALPRRGAVNFHDGPLPRYGGLYAPAWALMAGETAFGITWHVMTDAVDEGDILLQRSFPIAADDTSLTLNTRCFEAGVESFPDLVDVLERDPLTPSHHALDRSTYHGLSDRPLGLAWLDWRRPAGDLAALVRALDFGTYANPIALPKIVTPTAVVLAGALVQSDTKTAAPGTVLAADDQTLRIAAHGGTLTLGRLLTIDGAPLTGAEALGVLGAKVGSVLPPPDDARIAALDTFAKAAARHEGWWLARLAGGEPLDLPYADRGRAGDDGYAVHVLDPAQDRTDLVAAFVLYLARLTSRTTVHVTLRDGEAGETILLAPFVSPRVPLQVTLDPEASLDAARSAVVRALEGARTRVGIARDVVARHPALRPFRGRPFGGPVNIELVPHLDGHLPPEGDLTLVVAANGDAQWLYNTRVLSPDTIAAMARQFAAIRAATDARPWTTLPLLDAPERERILDRWNASARPIREDRCTHHLIEEQVAQTPDAVAVVFEDGQLTYRELNARANQLARHLRTLGAGPDVLVGLCCERSLDMVVGLLGIHKAGAAYVPLDPTYPVDRLALMLEDAQVQVVVTQEAVLGDLPETRAQLVCLDRDWETIAHQDDTNASDGAAPEHLAYCIYTSGSTGRPKGVMVEHRNVVNFFAAMDDRLGTDAGTWLAVTSLSFDISVLELLWTLTRGYKVVIYADENRAAAATADLANTHKGVDFSLFYFSADENEDQEDRYRLLLDGARFGDKHGFTAVWTPERHFHAFGGLYPNPAVTGAAIAAITKRIGIRAGSCVLPLHHPVRVAEEWAVVDNISGGRVGISFAAGWQPNDFILRPENHADAKKKMVAALETVHRLWQGETLTFPGPGGDVQVRTLPRPVQAKLPVWFTTAGNPESYELAGTLGVNVLTHLLGQTVDELADKITRYRRARRAAGHAGEGQISLMLHTFVGDSDAEVKQLVRAPMKAYLGTSISLIKGHAAAFPTFKKKADGSDQEIDFQSLSADEMDSLLEYSFERYYETSGLFGTVETCAALVDRLKGIGVDEIACLIDFGVATDLALRHLKHLNRLRVLSSRPRAAHADYSVAAQIARHKVTHLQCTPSMAGMLVANDRSRDALRSMKTVCIGGEAFPPSLAATLERLTPGDVWNMYGPTETTIWSAMHRLDGAPGAVPLGTPLANTELYVLDAFRQPVPPGVAGELYIGGAGVVRGYWRRAQLTTERFVSHPFRRDPTARLYRTGDLVRWRDDGTLDFIGRVDFQVKIRGYRIELGEIEATLAAHPLVREGVVVARDDGDGDKRLIAYVVWSTPQHDGIGDLRTYLRGRLPDFMVPSHFVVLGDLPRTPNAKVDRNRLPDPDQLQAPRLASAAPVAPAGELEGVIAAIWREVLKLETVGVKDNFFDLGGHSLLAVRVHSRLKKQLGRDLSITDLFRFPTIRGLAGYLGGEVDDGAARAGKDRAAARRAMASRRRRPTS